MEGGRYAAEVEAPQDVTHMQGQVARIRRANIGVLKKAYAVAMVACGSAGKGTSNRCCSVVRQVAATLEG